MATADMATWRRQNSDKHPVDIQLVDGSILRGTLMIPRDQNLRVFMNVMSEAFIDFDCNKDGPIVLAKVSIRRILPEGLQKKEDQAKIDALVARQAELQRNDPYKVLGVSQSVGADELRKAYISKARIYHPDRFADAGLPAEMLDYLNAMTRRINGAYEEISATLEAAAEHAAAVTAAAKTASPKARF